MLWWVAGALVGGSLLVFGLAVAALRRRVLELLQVAERIQRGSAVTRQRLQERAARLTAAADELSAGVRRPPPPG